MGTDNLHKTFNLRASVSPCENVFPGQLLFLGLTDLYHDWKDILWEQIDLYDPDIIIVCGTSTLGCMSKDLGLNLSKPLRSVRHGSAVVDIHHWRGKSIIWVPHPAARITPEEWVDAVVKAAH